MSGETRPASSEQEVQSERQTTQVESSNLSEKAGLVTSRYGRTIKPNRRYTSEQ